MRAARIGSVQIDLTHPELLPRDANEKPRRWRNPRIGNERMR